MSNTLRPYLNAVRASLNAALCLENFSSQVVERHNKPEIEAKASNEVLLTPIVISRNEKEKPIRVRSLSKMKYFAFLIIASLAVSAFAGLTEEEKEKVKEVIKSCVESTGVDKELVKKIKTDKVYTEGDAKFDEYCLCFFKGIHWFNDDGTINADKIKARVPAEADKDAANKIIDDCAAINDGAATARKVAKCLTEGRQNYLATH